MSGHDSSPSMESDPTGNTTPIKVDHGTSTAEEPQDKPSKKYDRLARSFCELSAVEKERFQELVTADRTAHSIDNFAEWHEYYLELLGCSSTEDDPDFYSADGGAEMPPVVRKLLDEPRSFSGFMYANADWALSCTVYAAGLFTAMNKGLLTASQSAYPTVATMVQYVVNELNKEIAAAATSKKDANAAATAEADANADADADAAATNPEPATAGPSRKEGAQPPLPIQPPHSTAGLAQPHLRVTLNCHPKITSYRPVFGRLDTYEARCDLAVLSGPEAHVRCGILGRGWDENRDGALKMMQTFLALAQEDERHCTGRLRSNYGIITSGLSVTFCEMNERRQFCDTNFRDALAPLHQDEGGRLDATRLYNNIKGMLAVEAPNPGPPDSSLQSRRGALPRLTVAWKGKERALTADA